MYTCITVSFPTKYMYLYINILRWDSDLDGSRSLIERRHAGHLGLLNTTFQLRPCGTWPIADGVAELGQLPILAVPSLANCRRWLRRTWPIDDLGRAELGQLPKITC